MTMARWLKAIDDVLKVKVHHLQTGRIKNSEFIDWVDKQPTAEPKQEWISVKDRLPEQLKEVLICFDGYGKKSVSTATYRNYFYGKEWLSNMMSLSVDSVTHWMPLPEPPKEE